MFNRKSKKSSKRHSKNLAYGISANVAIGALGFQADVDTDSGGERVIDLIMIRG